MTRPPDSDAVVTASGGLLDLLAALGERGIGLAVRGDLVCLKVPGPMDSDLIEWAKGLKSELLKVLIAGTEYEPEELVLLARAGAETVRTVSKVKQALGSVRVVSIEARGPDGSLPPWDPEGTG